MIGTNEMSSTSMDISESFRPEDLAKADFFDFVTAPDMGIGIGVGVGVSMVGLNHPHLHQHHNHHNNNNNNVHERTAVTLAHDSTGGAISNDRVTSANVSNNNSNTNNNNSNNNNNNETGNANNNSNNKNSNNSNNAVSNNSSSNNNNNNNSSTHNNNNNVNSNSTTANSNNNNDPTLQGYEFWHADKEQNRLESTIFEDLDRYCWQQQQQQPTTTQQVATPTTTTHATHNGNTTTSSVNTPASSTTGSISQPSSASSLDNTDGQIYTLTVLNGSESWLKREPDSQLAGTLDLDSLLGNFPGYIKSEYPYDESGFGSDNNKTTNRSDPNGMEMPQVLSQHSVSNNVMSSQTLPPLISALSGSGGVTPSTDICNSNALNVNQQLALFQNNNNDWHMADHNAEQNSAESLLRSALQGKGYSKGLHIQNGITLLPSSPSVKDDEMRRILFSTEAEALGFGDSALNTTQIFDDPQNPTHNTHMGNGVGPTNANTMIVDDMFLSLENVFNDDFEKIKRIANEVQQYCNAPPDYANTSNDVMMQIAAPQTATTVVPAGTVNLNATNGNHQIPVQMQQQVLPTSTTTPNINLQARSQQQQQQQLKSESVVSTSTAVTPPANRLITPKINKKYKRSSSMTTANNNHNTNNNNNNPNVINNNNASLNGSTGTLKTPGGNISSGGSNSSNSSNSPTQCNGQRKERSLHYCSICAKGFKDKYSVNVHIRTHTGEKPFACSLCGKSFRQKAHLAKHYQTHMAQKNNGNLVKGNNAKHARHHNTVTANSTTSITTTPSPRNLTNSSIVSSTNLGAVSVPAPGNSRNSGGLDMLSVGVPTLNGAMNTPSRNLLPPANGLLANR